MLEGKEMQFISFPRQIIIQLTANSESKCSMLMHIHVFNIQACISNDEGESRLE